MESDGETASSQQQEQEGSPEPSLSPEEVEAAAEAKAAAEAAAEKRLVDEAADAAAEAAMPCSAVRVPVTFTVAVPGNPWSGANCRPSKCTRAALRTACPTRRCCRS